MNPPAHVLRKGEDANFALETALVALREDGDTPLTRAVVQAAFRADDEWQALRAEYEVGE